MINSKAIYKKASALLSRGYRNPEEIAKGEGIRLHYREDFQDLLGMYALVMQERFIFLNSRLEEPMTTMVLAHEIGHDQLHRDIAGKKPLQEYVLFDMKNRAEYEANAFAAHLLLPDTDVLSLLKEGMDIAETASTMHVNINLLLIKLTELNRLGMDLRIPFDADPGFLKKIKL